jgi:hypothetical protein
MDTKQIGCEVANRTGPPQDTASWLGVLHYSMNRLFP